MRGTPREPVLKTCASCGEAHLHGTTVLKSGQVKTQPVCRTCSANKTRGYEKRQRQRDPDSFNRRKVATRHGVSPEFVADLLEKQEGVCAVPLCTRPAKHIDHDHRCCAGTGGCAKCIRGILCRPCNMGLGHFHDDPVLLVSAANYLLGA